DPEIPRFVPLQPEGIVELARAASATPDRTHEPTVRLENADLLRLPVHHVDEPGWRYADRGDLAEAIGAIPFGRADPQLLDDPPPFAGAQQARAGIVHPDGAARQCVDRTLPHAELLGTLAAAGENHQKQQVASDDPHLTT